MQDESNRCLRGMLTSPQNLLRILIAILALTVISQAQDITGTIRIEKKLTKRRVTPSVSVYQRGVSVDLGKDADEEPLDFERSRVVIYLEGPGPANTDPAGPAEFKIQQLNRRFSPDLLVVPVGSKVSFPNMDPIFHNIFSLSKPKSFDLGSYDKGDTREVAFPKPGIVDIYCRLHPNMAAAIVVTPNQWYARSDRTGQFRIQDVPPGKYTIVAWHRSAGFFRKSIVVEPGHDSVTNFFIPIGEDSEAKGPENAPAVAGAGSR
jgi:plastocyanin